MPEMDRLITAMTQRNADRAVLVSDKPAQIIANGQQVNGAPLSGTQVEGMIEEIIPNHLRDQLAQSHRFQFPYQSSQGIFNIVVYRPHGILQVSISSAQEDAAQQNPRPHVNYDFPPTPPMAGQEAYAVQPAIQHGNLSTTNPLTPNLKSLNWGAFFLPLFWCITHSAWGELALLAGAVALTIFAPALGATVIVVSFIIASRANKVAWENREWDSITEFEEVQRTWTYWGAGWFVLQCLWLIWWVNTTLAHHS